MKQIKAEQQISSEETQPQAAKLHRSASPAEDLSRLTERHFIGRYVSATCKTGLRRRCIVCNPAEMEILLAKGVRKRMRHETIFECKQCAKPLCIVPCMELYHTQENYVAAYKRTIQETERKIAAE